MSLINAVVVQATIMISEHLQMPGGCGPTLSLFLMHHKVETEDTRRELASQTSHATGMCLGVSRSPCLSDQCEVQWKEIAKLHLRSTHVHINICMHTHEETNS